MKKLKNKDWAVTAENQLLIQAFCKDLEAKGLKPYNEETKNMRALTDYCLQKCGCSCDFQGIYGEVSSEYKGKVFYLPQDYQKALEYITEEVKPLFEDGKWYIAPHLENRTTLIKSNGKIEICKNYNKIGYYEFYNASNYNNSVYYFVNSFCTLNNFREATAKEVEEILIKYAKQQGYVGKVKVKNDNSVFSVNCDKLYFNKNYGKETLNDGFRAIYIDGKWREIVKEETIAIGQYEVEFKKDFISINGITYPKRLIESMDEIMRLGQVKSLNVGCSGQYKVDAETISKILNKLKSLENE